MQNPNELTSAVASPPSTNEIALQVAAQTAALRLQGIVDSAMDAIISVDEQQRIILFNRAAEKMFGYATAEIVGQPLARLIPDNFRQVHEQHIQRFGATGITTRTMGALNAVSGLRSNGTVFPVEASISQMETSAQKIYTVILRDISARVASDKKLRAQAALLHHAQEAILTCDLAGQVTFWNRGAERIYGWTASEMLGQSLHTRISNNAVHQQEKIMQTLLQTGEWQGEQQQFTKDQKAIIIAGRWVLVRNESDAPQAILIINNDITEKKKLESQFLRAQRLESIGTLASGIAHDMNNILAPILLAVQILQTKFSDEQGQKLLAVLQTNAVRGADLVKQILSFARGGSTERIPLQITHLSKEIIKVLQETLPKSITIRSFLPSELAPVSGDPTQLQQVLMNLCINARDAMPTGGTLTIAAEQVAIDEQYAALQPGATAGSYLVISVTDTGVGIAPENIDKIFDPFFTTKAVGTGTGLGLATVLGIVKNHRGFISVHSEPEQGTQFKIYLPALLTESPVTTETVQAILPDGHGTTILVVDDETAIREITKTTLEAHNYCVLTAQDGLAAVTICAAQKEKIALVITDMMMPFMSGAELLAALKKNQPDVRIIVTSGLLGKDKLDAVTQNYVNAFLAKPFTAGKLLQTIAEVLPPRAR